MERPEISPRLAPLLHSQHGLEKLRPAEKSHDATIFVTWACVAIAAIIAIGTLTLSGQVPDRPREDVGAALKGRRRLTTKSKLPAEGRMLDYLTVTLVFALTCSAVLVFIRIRLTRVIAH